VLDRARTASVIGTADRVCRCARARANTVVHARTGRRSQALRQSLECRRVLVEELGVEPAIETARLQKRMPAGEPV
jgi:hypothetical protein